MFIGVFGLAVATITAVFSIQVIHQTFWPPPLPSAPQDCRDAVMDLAHSLHQARQSAVNQSSEGEALTRFRSELGPVWKHEASIRRLCRADPAAEDALKRTLRLRYAEEHSIRYDSEGIAIQRRDVARLVRDLESTDSPGLR